MPPFHPSRFWRLTGLACLAALVGASASAQQASPPYLRALAAGYKASVLCSDLFNAGMTEKIVEQDDLQRIYPELESIVPALTATIDRERRTVSVAFDDKLPPRIALWRPNLGCAQLPIGASPQIELPRFDAKAPDLDARPWPMGDRDAAGRANADAAALKRALDASFDRRSYGQGSETTAVIVVQNGRIVAERYRGDFGPHMSQRTWSVGKSIAGTLIGVAAQQGKIDIAAAAAVPEWKAPGDPRGAITTEQLLRMASGLHSDHAGNRTDAIYFGGTTVTEQATAWPLEARPDTRWRYANNDILLAVRGLRSALGSDSAYLAFPFTELFWKIGMTRTVPETDWQGNFILSSQVWTTARDLARLGLLYVNDGMWDGERLLPAEWSRFVASHGPAQPASGYGYGASWWTFPPDLALPADGFVAQGNRGQYVAVFPSRRVVIVRRGFDGGGPANFDIGAFAKDILAALR